MARSYDVGPLDEKIDQVAGTVERSFTIKTSPVPQWGSGELASLTVFAPARGQQPATWVSFLVNLFLEQSPSSMALDLAIGDSMRARLHASSLSGPGAIAWFHVPSFVISRLLEEVEAGGQGSMGVWPGDVPLPLSEDVLRRLRTLTDHLDATIPGKPGSPVRLVGFRKYPAGLDLHVLNDSDVAIRGWRGILVAADPFGDELPSRQLTAGSCPLRPKAMRIVSFDNDDDPWKAFEADDLTVSLSGVATF